MLSGKHFFWISAGAISLFALYNHFQKIKPGKVYVRNMKGNYNARTVPPFGIFISESQKNNSELIAHEQHHWQQYQKMGLFGYYSTYAKQMKQYGYDAMPMEKEARTNENDYCKENYTDCVRKGLSKTVSNPKFRI